MQFRTNVRDRRDSARTTFRLEVRKVPIFLPPQKNSEFFGADQKSFHNFKGRQVRHVLIEGEPWFVAADVCRCLGLSVVRGVYNNLRPLDADEKRLTPQTFRGKGGGSLTTISESGLYKLIMRAQRTRREVATFQDWVTREVLPAIRKTGGYLLNEEARETAAADRRDEMPIPQTYPDALRAFADEVDRPLTEGFDNPMQSWGNSSSPISPHP